MDLRWLSVYSECIMAGSIQIDWKAVAEEANIRALLESLVRYYKGRYPGYELALAVWFQKTPQAVDHNLLALFTGPPMNRIVVSERQPLEWPAIEQGPPFVNIHATSVAHFLDEFRRNRAGLAGYFDRAEAIYFDKLFVPPEVLSSFGVVTEPPGLVKGWYVTQDQLQNGQSVAALLSIHRPSRPYLGIVKVWEAPDLAASRALLHAEFDQRWLPVSPSGLEQYSYFNDWRDGRQVYFLFEGGALYRADRFEVTTEPEYSARVLEKLPDDRYPVVYLRAVSPSPRASA